MENLRKIILISITGAILFVVFEIAIGHLFINILGLYDPYPRGAEFGSIISGFYMPGLIFFGLYLVSLLMVMNEIKVISYRYLLFSALVLAFILSLFNRWYDIPREQSFWVIWLLSVIFMVIVVFVNKGLSSYLRNKNG